MLFNLFAELPFNSLSVKIGEFRLDPIQKHLKFKIKTAAKYRNISQNSPRKIAITVHLALDFLDFDAL